MIDLIASIVSSDAKTRDYDFSPSNLRYNF